MTSPRWSSRPATSPGRVRRGVVAAAVGALVAVPLAGCDLRWETPPPTVPVADEAESVRQRTTADALSLGVLAERAAAVAADPGVAAAARLRLAALELQAGQYEAALQALGADMPPEFAALAADRRGDVLLAQGQTDAARQAYQQAWAAMDEAVDYRRVIEAKLNALGVDPTAPATPAAPVPAAAEVNPAASAAPATPVAPQ